jgi:thiol-disulfide isomerase/thioredoxin
MRLLALPLFSILLLANSPDDQPDPRQLLLHAADAIKKYDSYQIHSLSLIETRGGMNNHMQMPAVISVRRPDLMRIESQNEAAGMTVVSDGAHTFVYLDQQKKYIKRAATSSPESALGETGVIKNLPDISKSVESVKITGEKTMEIDEQPYECWVVEARYGTITLPGQELTITNAVQVSWISKTLGLTLQSSFNAHLVIGRLPEPVEMTQATTTMGLSLNADLPDSLFVFTPPAGAVETADWTLPGITKPDLEGKPAPAIKGAPPIKGKVVLLNFWTAWSAPCKTELPILDKLQKQFRAQGLVVLGMNVGNDQAAVTFPTIHLKDDDELLKTLSVNAYPTLILIDRTGKIALYEVGAKTEPALRAALAKLGIKPETTPAKPPVPKTAK